MIVSSWICFNYFVLLIAPLFMPSFRQARVREPIPKSSLMWLILFSTLGAVPVLSSALFPEDYLTRISWMKHDGLQVVGLVIHSAGLVGCLWAQKTMAGSWRLPTVQGQSIELVVTGPYSKLRHPIYFFVLLMNLGLLLCFPDIFTATLAVLSCFVLRRFAIVEEKWMLETRGQEYKDFMARVPRWGVGKKS